MTEHLARAPRERCTSRTIAEAALLYAEVAHTGPDRLGRSREERHLGIIDLARLVRDGSGARLGTFNVALPSMRFSAAIEARSIAAPDRAEASLGRAAPGPSLTVPDTRREPSPC